MFLQVAALIIINFRRSETRTNIARLLARDGRISAALLYARAALDNFQSVGQGDASDAARVELIIAYLERHSR